jgi:outer membrane protein OmpA-like peptidoglycan-associated protein
MVPNGNFEYKKGKRHSSRPWRFVNTVDFFVTRGSIRRPKLTEKWNIPNPKDGVAFIGLRIYSNYREFVQIKLSEKLQEGNKYYFEMWVSWSDHSNYYAKRLGASLYRKKPAYTSEFYVFTNPPQIDLKESKGIVQSDSTQWVKISGVYRSKGGEKYLSIGNFSTTKFRDRLKKVKWWSLNFWHHEAYYFVDQVSLVKLEEYSPEKDSILVENIPDSSIIDVNENYIYKIEKDSTIVVKNIQFASGEARLLPRSYKDLELILEYLNENRTKKIQIIGHTDDIGSENANQKLSEKRAKTVYQYFLSNRMDKSRISYIGMGESQPISSNEDGLGRRANRRVELKLQN